MKFHVTKICTNCNLVYYQYSMKCQLPVRVKGFVKGSLDWDVIGLCKARVGCYGLQGYAWGRVEFDDVGATGRVKVTS